MKGSFTSVLNCLQSFPHCPENVLDSFHIIKVPSVSLLLVSLVAGTRAHSAAVQPGQRVGVPASGQEWPG